MKITLVVIGLLIVLAKVSCQSVAETNVLSQQGGGESNCRSMSEVASSRKWEKIASVGGFVSAISFRDGQHGFASGPDGLIWQTADGGITWKRDRAGQVNGRRYDLIDLALVSAETVYALGNLEKSGSAIFTSVDGGRTWKTSEFKNASLNGIANFKGVVWAVGTKNSRGVVLRSTEEAGWTPIWIGNHKEYLTAVDFVDGNTGWCVGFGGLILHTNDGGATWARQSVPTKKDLEAVSFLDHNIGYAVGRNGTILSTVDGGNTWAVRNSGVTANLLNVAVANGNAACAVGQDGIALCTDDAGRTWQLQDVFTDGDIYGITIRGNKSWISGERGEVIGSSLN